MASFRLTAGMPMPPDAMPPDAMPPGSGGPDGTAEPDRKAQPDRGAQPDQRGEHEVANAEYPAFWDRLDDYLRAARRIADLSQHQMSVSAGVAPTTLARLESGSARDPRLSTVARLLAAADLRLLACDRANRPIEPQPLKFGKHRDLGGRRLPAHLDAEPARNDDPFRPWWLPIRGEYTFLRDRRWRDEVRRRRDGG
jgi:transcriptional regulator with XRE-family HTH domain